MNKINRIAKRLMVFKPSIKVDGVDIALDEIIIVLSEESVDSSMSRYASGDRPQDTVYRK